MIAKEHFEHLVSRAMDGSAQASIYAKAVGSSDVHVAWPISISGLPWSYGGLNLGRGCWLGGMMGVI
ncbi:MAG: hypothetical protein Q6J68_03855, partial [Thermostichales cyanobacterium SZTDM-1c_bins_54]